MTEHRPKIEGGAGAGKLAPSVRLHGAMDAMILAAGLGTRLRPLTDRMPKPLVPVAGVPILERVARRLIDAGADRLIINTHHHADQLEEYVASRDGFGVEVRFSAEPDGPLDTGGGLLRARPHFRLDAPFFLHNGDILTDAPLAELYRTHLESDALATLAVRPPRPTRYLIFDDAGLLGFAPRGGGEARTIRDRVGEARNYHFAGIHVIEPRIFELLTEEGVFSIVDSYLRLSKAGERIAPFAFAGTWLDIGTHEALAEADQLVETLG